jgi:AraC-like DNA-binding protein
MYQSARLSTSWSGRALIKPGLALFFGHAGENRPHNHYAVQLALSASGFVTLIDEHGQKYAGGFVNCAAGTTHRLEPTDDEIMLVYLEPTSTIGLAAQRQSDGISVVELRPQPSLVNALRGAVSNGLPEAAEALLHSVFDVGDRAVKHRRDPRIVELLGTDSFQIIPPPLPQAARQTALSSSRFSHLFSAEMGISYRAFRKWRKLIATLERVANGAQLTAAAHDGGFADSAHFSRTFKDTFGLSPREALSRMNLSPPISAASAK